MNRYVKILSIVYITVMFLFSAVSLVRAGWDVDVCAGGQHQNGGVARMHFSTQAEVNQMLNNMNSNDRPCFTVEPGGCDDPCNSSNASASSSDDLDHLAAQVILDPHSTSQQRVVAFAAPLLQGFIEGLFSQPDNSAYIAQQQEEQRRIAQAAYEERMRQIRLAEEKYQRIKSMLKPISSADSVTMTSI